MGGSLASPVQQKMGGARKWRVFAKMQKKSPERIAAGAIIIIAHILVLFSTLFLFYVDTTVSTTTTVFKCI